MPRYITSRKAALYALQVEPRSLLTLIIQKASSLCDYTKAGVSKFCTQIHLAVKQLEFISKFSHIDLTL